MGDKTKHLVRAGHEFAAAMSDDTPIITIAKMVTELASALDVQSARSDALAAERNTVNADNAYLRDQVLCWARECDRITYTYTNKVTDAHQSEAEQELATTLPAADAWVNEQRAAILDAAFEAAKQEVERRFGRTFQDCAWLARRSSDTQMKGAVEMAEWVELYAAQLRGSQV